MNPKVSIIIPVYNGSNYLKEAIDSALAQTYNNIEIIVVNDGSNDNGATEAIAKSFGKKIRYYRKENGGVATALNLGIEKMTGEYFSWLSHDDLYYPKKVEAQVDFLNSLDEKKVVIYSNYSLLKVGQIIPVIHNHEMLIRKKKYSLLRGCVNGIAMLIPKSILDEVGTFNPDLRCTQDYDLWCRIQSKYSFVHMQDVLSMTRIHPGQDSVVSPKVVSEGNDLWIKMVKKVSDKEKIKYEGTLFNFYYEMAKFLENTPYTGALDYCKSKMIESEKSQDLNSDLHKVSVIIPFYNRPKETINAVKSVLKQSHDNLEIILVNDGSKDDISSVRDFVMRHKNIKLLDNKKNLGPAASRNAGIREAKGEYIAFLDSDDEFVEEKISKQLSIMLRHNPDISYTSYLMRREGEPDLAKGGYGMTGIVVPRIISSCPIATPTVMIRRSILIDNDIFFDESIRVGEDTCFWLELAKHYEIFLIDEPLTIVNVNSGSHAYDNKKAVVGYRNILAYLMNDDYYKNYYYDISLLCNDFYKINKDRQAQIDSDLYIIDDEWAKSGLAHKLKKRVRSTVTYRIARKTYHEGIRAVIVASINKVKNQ